MCLGSLRWSGMMRSLRQRRVLLCVVWMSGQWSYDGEEDSILM